MSEVASSVAGNDDREVDMLIDCADCSMRDIACGDCVVSFLIGPPSQDIDSQERVALAVLADGGLVPPLRMVPVRGGPAPPRSGPASRPRGGPGSGSRRGSESA